MKELGIRTISGLIYAGLIWLALTAPQAWLWGVILFSVFFFLEASELAALLHLDRKFFTALTAVFWMASTAGIVYAAFTGSFRLYWNKYILIFIVLLWFLLAFMLVYALVTRHFKEVWGLFYLAVPYSVTLALLMVEPRFVLFLFIILWLNDTFAYLTGRFAGRHKIWPYVSPKKTWEGFAGGLLAVILIVYVMVKGRFFSDLFYFLPSTRFSGLVPLLTLTAILAVAGDFFESWLKRKAGVKDSGNLIPGHGGILDRLDSYLFAVTGFFVYLFWVNKWWR